GGLKREHGRRHSRAERRSRRSGELERLEVERLRRGSAAASSAAAREPEKGGDGGGSNRPHVLRAYHTRAFSTSSLARSPPRPSERRIGRSPFWRSAKAARSRMPFQ